jgi:hypothetical protein
MIISRRILLRKRNVTDENCVEIKTHFMFIKFLSDIRADCEIMWKNVIEPDRPQVTIHIDAEKMRFAFRITKARKDTLVFTTSCFCVAKMVTRTRHKYYVIRTLRILLGG